MAKFIRLIMLMMMIIIILKNNDKNFFVQSQAHPPIVPVNTEPISCSNNEADLSKVTIAIGIIYDNIWQYTKNNMIIIYKTVKTNYDSLNHRLYLHNGQMISMESSYQTFFEKSDDSLKIIWKEMSDDETGTYFHRFISLGMFMDQQSQFALNFMISSDGKQFRNIIYRGSLGTIKMDQKQYQSGYSSIIIISSGKSDNFASLIISTGKNNDPFVQVNWDINMKQATGFLCFSLQLRNAFRLQETQRQCNTTTFLLQPIQFGFIVDKYLYLVGTKYDENYVIYTDKFVIEKRNYESKFWIKKLSDFFICNAPPATFTKESGSIPKEPWPVKGLDKKSTTLSPFERGKIPTPPPSVIDHHPHQLPDEIPEKLPENNFYRTLTLTLFTVKNILMLIILIAVLIIVRNREKQEGISVGAGSYSMSSGFSSSTSSTSATSATRFGSRASKFGSRGSSLSGLSSSSAASSTAASSTAASTTAASSTAASSTAASSTAASSTAASSRSSALTSAASRTRMKGNSRIAAGKRKDFFTTQDELRTRLMKKTRR